MKDQHLSHAVKPEEVKEGRAVTFEAVEKPASFFFGHRSHR